MQVKCLAQVQVQIEQVRERKMLLVWMFSLFHLQSQKCGLMILWKLQVCMLFFLKKKHLSYEDSNWQSDYSLLIFPDPLLAGGSNDCPPQMAKTPSLCNNDRIPSPSLG